VGWVGLNVASAIPNFLTIKKGKTSEVLAAVFGGWSEKLADGQREERTGGYFYVRKLDCYCF